MVGVRVGPIIGSFVALVACMRLAKRIEVAKLYHFETDYSGAMHKMSRRSAQTRSSDSSVSA